MFIRSRTKSLGPINSGTLAKADATKVWRASRRRPETNGYQQAPANGCQPIGLSTKLLD